MKNNLSQFSGKLFASLINSRYSFNKQLTRKNRQFRKGTERESLFFLFLFLLYDKL